MSSLIYDLYPQRCGQWALIFRLNLFFLDKTQPDFIHKLLEGQSIYYLNFVEKLFIFEVSFSKLHQPVILNEN